jgi:Kunitz/Bovine pancreatic trypsin inhibitor domain
MRLLRIMTALVTATACVLSFGSLGCGDDVGDDAEDPCSLKPDHGPCEAGFPKYYFDPQAGVCKEFVYGGCEGTVPFDTLEACKAACESK